MKKILICLLCIFMVASMVACSEKKNENKATAPVTSTNADTLVDPYQSFLDNVDPDFSSEVQKALSELGDDPVLGFRSAGSPAEYESAEYIEGVMKDIGLQNVTIDKVDVDGWTFKGANLTFTNSSGKEQKIDLGGYQTTIKADNEKLKVVYLGRGTANEYKNVDVKGKLVLFDINQMEEYWINMPSYQAHIKGARAVLANTELPEENPDRIGSQDFCGPDDAPALAISQKDTDAIKEAIKASGKDEIEVTLNADSKVTENTESTNVWGEIPGKTDEVIYVMAHRDGYYHSYFDDASGDGLSMGIAKAIMDSGYKPDKTIRFICHGAEEWGKNNSQADWAIGSYKQITEVHPEWAENAFAIVNLDGAYTVDGETHYGIAVVEELYNFIDPLAQPMIAETSYEYRYLMPPSTYKEDFAYIRAGIPSVGTAKGTETVYYDKGYHTSADTVENMGFDSVAWMWMHELYGRFIFAFDELAVRPMDFTTRFEALRESYDDSILKDDELLAKIDGVITAAKPIATKVNQLNDDYAAALKSGDTDKADGIRAEAVAYNAELHALYKMIQDRFLHLDQEMSIIFPHENRQSNILNIQDAIKALEDGKVEDAYSEYLSSVGNGWNAMAFDKKTVDFFNESMKTQLNGTWAEGLVDIPDCYVDDIVRSLMAKEASGNKDYAVEIKDLKALEQQQLDYFNSVIATEKDNLDSTVKDMDALK